MTRISRNKGRQAALEAASEQGRPAGRPDAGQIVQLAPGLGRLAPGGSRDRRLTLALQVWPNGQVAATYF